MRPQRRQPTRLPCPWDSPGKNTGVGCHFLLQCRRVKSENEVTQSCPTLRDPMDCSLPGSSVHGIFQARVLEWGREALTIILIHLLCVRKRRECSELTLQVLIHGVALLHIKPVISTVRKSFSCPFFFFLCYTFICVYKSDLQGLFKVSVLFDLPSFYSCSRTIMHGDSDDVCFCKFI